MGSCSSWSLAHACTCLTPSPPSPPLDSSSVSDILPTLHSTCKLASSHLVPQGGRDPFSECFGGQASDRALSGTPGVGFRPPSSLSPLPEHLRLQMHGPPPLPAEVLKRTDQDAQLPAKFSNQACSPERTFPFLSRWLLTAGHPTCPERGRFHLPPAPTGPPVKPASDSSSLLAPRPGLLSPSPPATASEAGPARD